MICPNCSQIVVEESRFCSYCGCRVNLQEAIEQTRVEILEATVCESMEDVSEKTRMFSHEIPPSKPKKTTRPQKKPTFFAWLVSLKGSDKGKDYRIMKEKTSIGKSEDNEMVIRNDFVSKNHAVLFYDGKKFILNDLQSTNHTFVNDKKISRKVLNDNDIIKFGEAIYKFKRL